MTKTIVAIYNSKEQAQNAKDQLLKVGYNNNDIDVSSGKTDAADSNEQESGISRFFKNLFGNNDENTERYSNVAAQGYVVTVYANSDDEAQRTSSLLDDYGAIDVDDSYNRRLVDKKFNADQYDEKSATMNEILGNRNVNERFDDRKINADDLDENNRTIPVIEEDIQIGKKEVITGGVRIRSRIIEKPVEENLRLREEHIHVERNKVDRAATDDDLRQFKNTTMEMTSSTEIPDVRKTSKVVEEVFLEKEVNHRDETIHDKVRKTEVDVEDMTTQDNIKNRNL
ncbi:MAG: YsnF/AvaK domain-containing protein [Chitinophagaceae bacterium]